ncbi:putative membrane protein [Desulfosporosinus acidiphilus SJ4]|uniref:Putative membrane protein n=1 Tax=Desulfosporosinus acidiphilus (strain DSM 22704 / JCM 16185 / SJ4) TaxID=646529 RepID=I4DBY2_DESAJ|nr:DUF445 domain-containing protein [Desulfosporosinus acidiphilus]AFM43306.1 putative membrane protein [Desulfosporosinus acidiphilus SJ4]
MVKKINNTQSANLTLGGITLGFLLSYPFHATSFVGGLISSGCSAGMIGGLADWFAVTALFRRPLGIKPSKILRTEIIPRNRERIFDALADMVQDELLTQEVLKRKLTIWDFAGALIKVFQQDEVKDSAKELLADLSENFIRSLDTKPISQSLMGLFQDNLSSFELSRIFGDVLEFSLEHGEIDYLLKTFCGAMREFLAQPSANRALTKMVDAAITRYGANNPTRKLVGKFLPSPDVLAQGLIDKGKTALQDGTVEQWLKESLHNVVLNLKTNREMQEKFTEYCSKVLTYVYSADSIPENAESERVASSGPNFISTGIERGMKKLRDNWDQNLELLKHKPAFRKTLNGEIQDFLQKQIEVHHDFIGRMVREGLYPLTDDRLVRLIEEKAGNDLQMIRINGSIVGGLVGMLIYVLGMVFR